MGPYCQYCDRRCFVERVLPFGKGHMLMATCDRGMAHDREAVGVDHRQCVNPHDPEVYGTAPVAGVADTPPEFSTMGPFEAQEWAEAAVAELTAERDRARATAVELEQQLARIRELCEDADHMVPLWGDHAEPAMPVRLLMDVLEPLPPIDDLDLAIKAGRTFP